MGVKHIYAICCIYDILSIYYFYTFPLMYWMLISARVLADINLAMDYFVSW